MIDRYIVYRCKICGKHTILISNEVDHTEKAGKYQTCGHDGRHRELIVCGAYDSIKECMDHDSYSRIKGRIKQR